MNEALDPLGIPTPAQEDAATLGELVAQHPMLALAASAAVGAGLMALVSAASRPHTPHAPHTTRLQAGLPDKLYGELRDQIARLAERMNASLPDKGGLSQTLSDLSTQASGTLDSAAALARDSMRSAIAGGAKATRAAADHPVITSLVVGAIGAVAAALAASGETAAEGDTPMAPPNGHDTEAPVQHDLPTM
ncbi:MAG: hypothetical protein KF891_19795 [Rhizobacter sp.]|nr:hypothetical protein [Rhizobacter sp.]